MPTPFDKSLEARALREAAETYALGRGDSGSPEYRAAWLRFRQRIKTIEHLQSWRASAARRQTREPPGRLPSDPAHRAGAHGPNRSARTAVAGIGTRPQRSHRSRTSSFRDD